MLARGLEGWGNPLGRQLGSIRSSRCLLIESSGGTPCCADTVVMETSDWPKIPRWRLAGTLASLARLCCFLGPS